MNTTKKGIGCQTKDGDNPLPNSVFKNLLLTVIALILTAGLAIGFSSCGPTHYVRKYTNAYENLHGKCLASKSVDVQSVPVNYALRHWPLFEKADSSLTFTAGTVQISPGPTETADCDAAIREALAGAKGLSDDERNNFLDLIHKLQLKAVPCPQCPPSTVRHDAVEKKVTVTLVDVRQVDLLTKQLANKDKVAQSYAASARTYKKATAYSLAGCLLLIALIIAHLSGRITLPGVKL